MEQISTCFVAAFDSTYRWGSSVTPGARGAKWPPVRAAGIGIPTRRDPEISQWEPVPPGGRILFLSTAPGCSISLALLVSETCARYGRAGRAERCRTPAGLERCWRSGSGSGSGSGRPFRAAPRTHGSGRVRAGRRFPGWVGAALGRAKAAVGRPVGSPPAGRAPKGKRERPAISFFSSFSVATKRENYNIPFSPTHHFPSISLSRYLWIYTLLSPECV